MPTENEESPFQVGVEVAVELRGAPSKDRVAKVYKNGHITLEGNPKQQLRVLGSTAHAMGGHRIFDSVCVRVWTPDHDAKLVAYELKDRWWKAVNEIYKKPNGSKPTREQVEAAEALADSFKPVEEGN